MYIYIYIYIYSYLLCYDKVWPSTSTCEGTGDPGDCHLRGSPAVLMRWFRIEDVFFRFCSVPQVLTAASFTTTLNLRLLARLPHGCRCPPCRGLLVSLLVVFCLNLCRICCACSRRFGGSQTHSRCRSSGRRRRVGSDSGSVVVVVVVVWL